MSTVSVLKLSDFFKIFVVETDVSGMGVGTVLMQEGYLLIFISKVLSFRYLFLSVYEKELMIVVLAVEKWKSY